MNYYERHIGDYLKDTSHLSLLEHGIYSRLMDVYYTRESGIPEKDATRLIGARSRDERAALSAVLAEFFVLIDGVYQQDRCEREIARFRSKSQKAKVSAAASVAARQASAKTNAQLRSERMAAAKEKGTHTLEQWTALRHVCGYRCVKCGAEGNQTRDHIVPVYQGGSDAIDNIQPLCTSCNSAKGPEQTDYRPPDWADGVQRTLNERSANLARSLNDGATKAEHRAPVPSNQTPDTRHQTPESAVVHQPLPEVEPEKPALTAAQSSFQKPLPEGWQPSPETVARIVRARPDLAGRVPAIAEDFRLYLATQTGAKTLSADWESSFLRWAAKEREPPGKHGGRVARLGGGFVC